jgi:hypothetical protein
MDFFGLINGVRDNVLRPYVMVLEREGEPRALVIGRVVRQDFLCRLGYKTIRLGQVRELNIIYGSVLGCAGEDCAGAVLNELNRMLRQPSVALF